MSRVEITAASTETVTFTVWVDGERYDCPIARRVVEALSGEQYFQGQEKESYPLLKEQVLVLVESLVRSGNTTLHLPLPASHRLH